MLSTSTIGKNFPGIIGEVENAKYRVDSFAYWFNLFIGPGGILDSKSIPIGFPNIGKSEPEVPKVSLI